MRSYTRLSALAAPVFILACGGAPETPAAVTTSAAAAPAADPHPALSSALPPDTGLAVTVDLREARASAHYDRINDAARLELQNAPEDERAAWMAFLRLFDQTDRVVLSLAPTRAGGGGMFGPSGDGQRLLLARGRYAVEDVARLARAMGGSTEVTPVDGGALVSNGQTVIGVVGDHTLLAGDEERIADAFRALRARTPTELSTPGASELAAEASRAPHLVSGWAVMPPEDHGYVVILGIFTPVAPHWVTVDAQEGAAIRVTYHPDAVDDVEVLARVDSRFRRQLGGVFEDPLPNMREQLMQRVTQQREGDAVRYALDITPTEMAAIVERVVAGM